MTEATPPAEAPSAEAPSTADICDELEAVAATCATQFRHYGAHLRFSGEVATVRCSEDNVLVRATLSEPGCGRVLVVDGGGSLRAALMGDVIAGLAVANGWAGVIINGAVRDVARLRDMPLGILALGANPKRSAKTGAGTAAEPVAFGGATFHPGDAVHADEDGVVVLPGEHRPRTPM
jgi:regulator of ribonuclease activity A